jgi:hypothetical protein
MWNNGRMILTGKNLECEENNLSHYNSVHYKSHMDWPEI